MHLLKMLLRCIDAVGCVKKRHAPRCIHKIQAILSGCVCLKAKNFILNEDFTVILEIIQVKNTVENVHLIFVKMADQSYFVNIVLIAQNKC